jgi:hypothetical protein
MMNIVHKAARFSAATTSTVAIALMIVSVPSATMADEAYAKSRLKAMSDYLAAQNSISFGFDANFEVVTKEHQKLSLMSSALSI